MTPPRASSDLLGSLDLEALRDQPARRRSGARWIARLLGLGARSNPRTLRLALECGACRRIDSYDVETVYLDPELGAEPIIADRIQCRGCGCWDNYSLTLEAREQILAEILRLLKRSQSPGSAPQSPITLVSSGLQDGRKMSPEDGLRDYERRLVENPHDPGLHIGHGNLLRFLKRVEAAETSYRRAIDADPHAAEAYASLAQLAAARGDFLDAARQMERCVQVVPHRHFYRLRGDERHAFSESVREELVELRRLAGLGDRPVDSPSAEQHRTAVPSSTVGRNALCPCGSGKKFKKCCLAEGSAGPASAQPASGYGSAADDELGRYLAAEAARVPRRERERALALFSRARSGSKETAVDGIAFFDWFIHDYGLATSGRTIVEKILLDRSHDLSPGARTLLGSWRDAAVHPYEVIAVEPGVGITLRDLLGSAEHRIREVRGSRCLARWDVVATRLVPIDGEMRISATVLVFRPDEKAWLLSEVERRFLAWVQDHPGAARAPFLKTDGLLFHTLAGEVAERRRAEADHITAMTPEGHPIVIAKAQYKLRDAARVLAALRASDDFELSGAGTGRRPSFVWLKRGSSARLAPPREGAASGLEITSYFHSTPDAEGAATLGDVRIRGSRLLLECLSRERLAWGMTRLADLLGDAVIVETEQFDSLDARRAAARKRAPAGGARREEASGFGPTRSEFGDARHRDIVTRHLQAHYVRWMDTPLPVLGAGSRPGARRATLASTRPSRPCSARWRTSKTGTG